MPSTNFLEKKRLPNRRRGCQAEFFRKLKNDCPNHQVGKIIHNFAGEMHKQGIHKDRIDAILIKGKKYREPDFSAQTLAEMLEVSASKLSRIIKDEYGDITTLLSLSSLDFKYGVEKALYL